MATIESRYLPADRLRSLATGIALPSLVTGSALFADIAGFTALTEQLTQALGPRRGAETLTVHLNAVYTVLITEVERYQGIVINFSGDAITCWFDGDQSAQRATVTAFALLDAIDAYKTVVLADGETAMLGLKVAIASGITRRFVVGDPAIQRFDTLAGATVSRMSVGESVASRGEVVVDLPTVERLGFAASVREWRTAGDHRLAVLDRANLSIEFAQAPVVDTSNLTDDQLRSWLLPAVARQLEAGLGEFLTELRPVVALFLRFSGIDYDGDPDAGSKLDQLLRQAQAVITTYEGNVVSLNVGDKGSYIGSLFGAPVGHEDDTHRALKAALDLHEEVNVLGYLEPTQVGISQGIVRTGAYGSETRRTYGVFGDDVNLASRLMIHASSGTILVSEAVARVAQQSFHFQSLPPLRVKGKVDVVPVLRLIGPTEISFADRFYTTPLTGRDVELSTLLDDLRPIFEGRHAGVVIIHGQPGMGKSRLAHEARLRLQSDFNGLVVWLTGQTDEQFSAPLYAVSQALRPYFRQSLENSEAVNARRFDETFEELIEQAGMADRRQALQRGRGFLARLVGAPASLTASEDFDEKTRLENTIAALKDFVRAAARGQAVVLHFEDVRWLDGSSLRVVQELTYAMKDVALAVVLTSRDTDDGQRFTLDDVYEVPVHNIDLSGWTGDDLRIACESVLGGPVADAVVTYVRNRAEGNPFFTEQLLLDLKERDMLVDGPAGWHLQSEAIAEVPPTVNAVLIARLDRLPAEVKSVVQRAAILGREVDTAVLAGMLRVDEQRHIQAAEDAGLWTRIADMRCQFRHALLRDAAYEMQVEARRRELHRLAAQTIEAVYPNDPVQDDALLEHWHAAGEINAELKYLDRVVRRLIEIEGQYETAQRLLERSLGQLTETDPSRVLALNWLGQGAWRRGLYAEASEAAQAARTLAEALGDRAGLATSLHSLGVVAERQGMYEEAQACFEQSRALNESLGNPRGVAASLNSLGIVATAQGAHHQARDYFETSLAMRRALGERRGMSACLTNLAEVAWHQRMFDEARAYIEQSLDIDRELHDRAGIATGLSNLGRIVKEQGDYGQARALNEESLILFRELGDLDGVAFCLDNLGSLAAELGDYDQARAYLEQSLQISRELGDPVRIATSLEHIGEIDYWQERYTEAEKDLQDALNLRQEIGSTDPHSNLLHWLARTKLQLGDTAAARTLLRETLSAVDTLEVGAKLATLLLASELYLAEGRFQSALDAAERIRNHPASNPEQRQDAERVLTACRTHLSERALGVALDTQAADSDIEIAIVDLQNAMI